jgi:hypothetical protein
MMHGFVNGARNKYYFYNQGVRDVKYGDPGRSGKYNLILNIRHAAFILVRGNLQRELMPGNRKALVIGSHLQCSEMGAFGLGRSLSKSFYNISCLHSSLEVGGRNA